MQTYAPSWWRFFPWVLVLIVLIPGFLLLSSSKSALSPLHPYVLFPVLGIWAWSLIWTHYIVGTLRRIFPNLPKNPHYSKITSLIVLTLIILHPGLLAYQQYISTKQLPPLSYFTYVAPEQAVAILFGILGLLLFLFYEVIEKMKTNTIVQKYWWVVNISQTIAVLSIYWHALTLGHDLSKYGWFRPYWMLLGIVLIPCLVQLHWSDLKAIREKK